MKSQTFFYKLKRPLKILSNSILSSFKISGHSMEPEIFNGDSVLVTKIIYLFVSPKINDIVAFKINESILIKRITKINKGEYFVRGDNNEDSFDSRKFGMILKDQIVGKVFYKF